MSCPMLLLLAILAVEPAMDPTLPIAATDVYVSARSGDDETGDGTHQKPFRTLTKGLSSAGSAPVVMHLDYGEYGEGESFPLPLAAGTRLIGRGSTLSTILGPEGGDAVLFRLDPGYETTYVQGIGLQRGSIGLKAELSDDAEIALVSLRANDVLGRSLGVGISLQGSPDGATSLDARALRFLDCETGLAIRGDTTLRLERSVFRANQNGLMLSSFSEDGTTDQRVLVRDCQFLDQVEAGVDRSHAGLNTSPTPLRFEGCLFRGNDVGIHLQIPGGDALVHVQECEFVENIHYGLRLVGRVADPGEPTKVEDCTFRWNGIGLYIVNLSRGFEMRRCRVEHSLGAGVFSASFLGERCDAWFEDNLIAQNGAAGIFVLSDGETLRATVRHCTIVGNAGGGVARKDKHGGATSLDVKHCILAFNTFDDESAEVWNVESGAVTQCLLGGGEADPEHGNVVADPRFLDRERQDYRLHGDSPARGAGEDGRDLGAAASTLER